MLEDRLTTESLATLAMLDEKLIAPGIG